MPLPSPEEAADLAACRALLRGGSRSFHAASLLLPRSIREPAGALYAFCRVADDAVDLHGGDRLAAIARLRDRLDRAYAHQPYPHPVDRALAVVVARAGVPRVLLDALLEGFTWDAEGRRYPDLPALEAYAARVAGSVGAMMATVMGVRDPATLARACDLGVAMQLTNIARDVGEDARAGRLYLPTDWLHAAGTDPDAWLARPVFTPTIADATARLLGAADHLYARGATGVARLPLGCRPGIGAARLLYAGIGRQVERQGLDSVTARAVVPRPRQLGLLAAGLVSAARNPPPDRSPPLPATRFLVEAAAAAAPPPRRPVRPSLDDRVGWVIELFVRLGELERS